jgi:hypothetical protein
MPAGTAAIPLYSQRATIDQRQPVGYYLHSAYDETEEGVMKIIELAVIALARIGQLQILVRAGARVMIPREVYEEVAVRGAGKPGATEVREAPWIETKEATPT